MPTRKRPSRADDDVPTFTPPPETEVVVIMAVAYGPRGIMLQPEVLLRADDPARRAALAGALRPLMLAFVQAAGERLGYLEGDDIVPDGPSDDDRERLERERYDPIVFSPRSAGRA